MQQEQSAVVEATAQEVSNEFPSYPKFKVYKQIIYDIFSSNNAVQSYWWVQKMEVEHSEVMEAIYEINLCFPGHLNISEGTNSQKKRLTKFGTILASCDIRILMCHHLNLSEFITRHSEEFFRTIHEKKWVEVVEEKVFGRIATVLQPGENFAEGHALYMALTTLCKGCCISGEQVHQLFNGGLMENVVIKVLNVTKGPQFPENLLEVDLIWIQMIVFYVNSLRHLKRQAQAELQAEAMNHQQRHGLES